MTAAASLAIKFGGTTQNLPGQVHLPGMKTMLFKATKAWLGLWAVALICLPVPVVHLVVTPLGLFFGPIMGILVFFKSRRMIKSLEGEADCPQCHKKFKVQFEDVLPPIYGMCPSCKAGYQVLVDKKSE